MAVVAGRVGLDLGHRLAAGLGGVETRADAQVEVRCHEAVDGGEVTVAVDLGPQRRCRRRGRPGSAGRRRRSSRACWLVTRSRTSWPRVERRTAAAYSPRKASVLATAEARSSAFTPGSRSADPPPSTRTKPTLPVALSREVTTLAAGVLVAVPGSADRHRPRPVMRRLSCDGSAAMPAPSITRQSALLSILTKASFSRVEVVPVQDVRCDTEHVTGTLSRRPASVKR